MSYRVITPYVTVPVRDEATGSETVHGFYRDAILPAGVNQKAADGLVKRGYLEKVRTAKAPAPAAAPPPPADQPPHGNASRETWAAHATGKGAPESETQPVEQGGLSRDDLRAKYGG